jgi:hypothetical protein
VYNILAVTSLLCETKWWKKTKDNRDEIYEMHTWITTDETTRQIQSWGQNMSFSGLTLWPEEKEEDKIQMQ